MANRTRFKATGLAALVGKITIRHSSGTESVGKTTYTKETQNVRRASNEGNRRSRKA